MTQAEFQNAFYTQDNLFVLCGMNSESVDLIYLDPPFNSKRLYSAAKGSKAAGSSFKDMWTWEDVNQYYLEVLVEKFPVLGSYLASVGAMHSQAMKAYLTYMAQRIVEMHRVLKDTGSIYLHCDPTASHYLKPLMDEIFGRNNFRNEIIWSYRTGGVGKRSYAKKHDVILFYSKTDSYFFCQPKTESRDVKRFNNTDENGRCYYDKAGNRYYADNGVAVTDVWDIFPVRNVSKERTGSPTQKPLALLHRIIEASSNKGDIVFDPFCGCATACVAAQQLGRRWIGIDIAEQSAKILVDRLSDATGLFDEFVSTTLIPQRTDVERVVPSVPVKHRLYVEQKGICTICGKWFEMRNLEIDHIVPKSKGGGDYYENYQLLCGYCNKVKGERPMDAALMKFATNEKLLKTKIIFGE